MEHLLFHDKSLDRLEHTDWTDGKGKCPGANGTIADVEIPVKSTFSV